MHSSSVCLLMRDFKYTFKVITDKELLTSIILLSVLYVSDRFLSLISWLPSSFVFSWFFYGRMFEFLSHFLLCILSSHFLFGYHRDYSSVQSLSRVRLFATSWIAARQASLSITISWSSFKLTSIESVTPSSHLILCCPFSSCPQSLPASQSFPMSQLFAWGGQSIGVSALASFLPKNTQGWFPLEWTSWISLQSKDANYCSPIVSIYYYSTLIWICIKLMSITYKYSIPL